MLNCDAYQAQLLEYLYEVLEPVELQALRGHLGSCPDCQSALERAKGQQKLLAAAARLDCSAVRFVAPAPPTAPVRARIAAGARPSAYATFVPLALAACVLLAVGTVAVAAMLLWPVYHWKTEHTRLLAEQGSVEQQRQQEAADARNQIEMAEKRLAKVAEQRGEELTAIENQQLNLVVSGQGGFQAGAPNPYQIQTLNRLGQPVSAKIDVSVAVRDKQARSVPGTNVSSTESQIVYRERNIDSKGEYELTLPPNLQVRPNSEVFLDIVARDEDGQEQRIGESLELTSPLYLTHLATDKPMYRPGETVHFRSLTLERFSLKPPDQDFSVVYALRHPSGKVDQLGIGSSRLQAAAGAPRPGAGQQADSRRRQRRNPSRRIVPRRRIHPCCQRSRRPVPAARAQVHR